jgi:GNAT superfamily N-acetyltransferase
MAAVDHMHRDAVVACLGSERDAPIVGIGSYDESRPGVAEIAFTVDDGYQGRRLGGQLLAWIIDAAEARGFERLQGEVLTENGRMLRLLYGSGYPCQLRPDIGSCRFSLTIGADALLPAAA